MLQIDVMPYASDALEDAMRLAQTKALNSYTYSDCLNYLNYAWRDIYDRMAMIDDGYYGRTIQLTKELTHLPDFVRNTVMVYAAQEPVGFNRQIFRDAGTADLTAPMTYRISGKDLYCRDASRRKVWLYYVPACAQLFFTNHNRDPKVYKLENDSDTLPELKGDNKFGPYNIKVRLGELPYYDNLQPDVFKNSYVTEVHIVHNMLPNSKDISNVLSYTDNEGNTWNLRVMIPAYPYIFCTYECEYVFGNSGQYMHKSGFYNNDMEWFDFNPFDFTGQPSNVEYVQASWNDKTGMGVIVKDWNDMYTYNSQEYPVYKEVGWTPDSKLQYPVPEMYRYLVARLADKFSALNESNIMGVQKELVEAKFAFEAFLEKDKSAWKRIENVNPATIGDWL